MPEHPNATRFRDAFIALWEHGDPTPTLELLDNDVHWINDIGAGPWHDIRGKQAVLDMYTEWNDLFDGGFRHELIDICASDHNVIEILHEIGTAHGQTFDNIALYRYELDVNGQITNVRTHDQDRDEIATFWNAIAASSVSPRTGRPCS